jgi:hypothetical protein
MVSPETCKSLGTLKSYLLDICTPETPSNTSQSTFLKLSDVSTGLLKLSAPLTNITDYDLTHWAAIATMG